MFLLIGEDEFAIEELDTLTAISLNFIAYCLPFATIGNCLSKECFT
jgi:hypothetical protein